VEQAGRIACLLVFAFLAIHEMGAIFNAAWRILSIL